MTEPGIGSDLASMTTTAVLDGDHYVVNGSKTFITNGINADLVITAVKTDPTQRHAGHEPRWCSSAACRASSGAATSRRSACTRRTPPSCSSPTSRCPSPTGSARRAAASARSSPSCPQERLSIAVTGVAAARQALDLTLEYVKERTAFGQPIGSFQNSRFRLAEMATEVEIAQTFVDRCVLALNAGELTAEEAAMAKWWCTELQKRVVDTCVQLHGGYGYMLEYPIARAYADARITTIYGGTTEIMKEIIGRGPRRVTSVRRCTITTRSKGRADESIGTGRMAGVYDSRRNWFETGRVEAFASRGRQIVLLNVRGLVVDLLV